MALPLLAVGKGVAALGNGLRSLASLKALGAGAGAIATGGTAATIYNTLNNPNLFNNDAQVPTNTPEYFVDDSGSDINLSKFIKPKNSLESLNNLHNLVSDSEDENESFRSAVEDLYHPTDIVSTDSEENQAMQNATTSLLSNGVAPIQAKQASLENQKPTGPSTQRNSLDGLSALLGLLALGAGGYYLGKKL